MWKAIDIERVLRFSDIDQIVMRWSPIEPLDWNNTHYLLRMHGLSHDFTQRRDYKHIAACLHYCNEITAKPRVIFIMIRFVRYISC